MLSRHLFTIVCMLSTKFLKHLNVPGDAFPESAVTVGKDNAGNDVYLARFTHNGGGVYGHYPIGSPQGYFEWGNNCIRKSDMKLLVLL